MRLPDLGERIAKEATGPVVILDTLFSLKPQVKLEFLDKGGKLSIVHTADIQCAAYQVPVSAGGIFVLSATR